MALISGFSQFPDEGFDPKLYQELTQIHLAISNLDRSVALGTGIETYPQNEWGTLGGTGAYYMNNISRIYCKTTEAIVAGEAVNLHASGGEIKARKAIATSMSTMAQGIASSTASGIGDWIEVLWMRGVTDSIGGLSLGSFYYLSETVPGRIANAPPVLTGSWIQMIGMAVSATRFMIDINSHITQVL